VAGVCDLNTILYWGGVISVAGVVLGGILLCVLCVLWGVLLCCILYGEYLWPVFWCSLVVFESWIFYINFVVVCCLWWFLCLRCGLFGFLSYGI